MGPFVLKFIEVSLSCIEFKQNILSMCSEDLMLEVRRMLLSLAYIVFVINLQRI